METINWNEYWYTLVFCAFGFLTHLISKLIMARKKNGYSFIIFLQRQWLGWILAWLFCMIGVYFAVKNVSILTEVKDLDILGLLIGYSGGSLGKNAIKIFLSKNNKEINE